MILAARGLGKSYFRPGGRGVGRRRLRAFEDVDLELEPGGSVALVGISGAGKSSLGRCLALLERPDEGDLTYRGNDALRLGAERLRRFRRDVQLVFQDAARSFNPHRSARWCLEEPLRLAGELDAGARRARLEELAGLVGLGTTRLERPVLDLSGGQLRRLNLARALSLEPRVLILDEPFAGLDLSLQAQIANVLLEIQRHSEIAILYISHDLALVRQLTREVIVLHEGRIVERGPALEVLNQPVDPATRRLVAAAPAAGVEPPTAP